MYWGGRGDDINKESQKALFTHKIFLFLPLLELLHEIQASDSVIGDIKINSLNNLLQL